MDSLRIGISTQTPLLRMTPQASVSHVDGNGLVKQLQKPDLQRDLSPGGVSRMVVQELREWFRNGWVRDAHWYSLQPGGPQTIQLDDPPVHLHHLSLPAPELEAYARTKEKLWSEIHGLPTARFETEDFRFYSRYNWSTSDGILEQSPDLDLVYVHDFQLLQVGALIGLAAPTVFRWHVPFDPQRIPGYTRQFVVRLMEDFDAVIVSTRRERKGLQRAGFQGPIHQIYPHIDPREWPKAKAADVERLEARLNVSPEDPVVLMVARMDPVKRHDVAMRAMARLRVTHPQAKLVLVGNGSFSNARQRGLGLQKADIWSRRLQELAKELRMEERVEFAHWVPNSDLSVLYDRADVVVLPSDVEGFGITLLEGWRYGKPVISSSGAGVSEVIDAGQNGYVFPSGDDRTFSEQIDHLLRSRSDAERMGAAGLEGLARFDVSRQAPKVADVMEVAVEAFRGD